MITFYILIMVFLLLVTIYDDLKRAGCEIGLKFNWHSLWFGLHVSPHNRRACFNFLPCCTLWLVLPGGNIPGNYNESHVS